MKTKMKTKMKVNKKNRNKNENEKQNEKKNKNFSFFLDFTMAPLGHHSFAISINLLENSVLEDRRYI